VDVDRFLAVHTPAWERLAALTARARRGVGRLDAVELDELVRLYQRTSTHLSYARTYYRDPALVARLTGLVAAAGSVVYGARPRTFRALARFFTTTFPAAVWHGRRAMAVSAVLLLVPAFALGLWLSSSDEAVEASAPAAVRQAYVEEDFEDYYSSEPAAAFATEVFTNNVRVAILAFAAGILLCVPTALLLVVNGANLGVAGGLFAAAGELPKFFGLILPHGLLELTAVIVAGGAGLRLGWAVIVPGDRSRRDALAEEGRRSVVVVLGLIVAFLVAGLIEGFVTGRPWPTGLRVGVGVAAEAAFLGYVVSQGRRAAAAGSTGLLGEDEGTGWASAASPVGSASTTALSPSP
jgi:uncharacterized membrane protein SpoIIM required for sporulation